MTDLLNLAERLEACWLDIVSAHSESPSLSACANLMHETVEAVRGIAIPRGMDLAAKDGGWVMGYVAKLAEQGYMPWLALTWGDGGWGDDGGNKHDPSVWFPIPDPQPKPTGWAPAEGEIIMQEITGEGWTCNDKPIEVPYRWEVYIEKPDGSIDEYREIWHYATAERAEARAAKWQGQFNLPIIVRPLPSNVVPFKPAGMLQ